MDDMMSLIDFDSSAPSPPTKPSPLPRPIFSPPMTPGAEWEPICPDTPKSAKTHSTSQSIPPTPEASGLATPYTSPSRLQVTIDPEITLKPADIPAPMSVTSPSSPGSSSTYTAETSTLRATAQPFQRRRVISPAQPLSFFPTPSVKLPQRVPPPRSQAAKLVAPPIRFRPPPPTTPRIPPYLQLPRTESVSIKSEPSERAELPVTVNQDNLDLVSNENSVLEDMEKNLVCLRDAFTEYSAGFEENLARLTMANNASVPTEVKNHHAALLEAREELQRLTLYLNSQKLTTQTALEEQKLWKARFDELSRRYLDLEETMSNPSRSEDADKESCRMIVLLHGTTSIFDDDFVAQVYSGGVEVSTILRDRLGEAFSLTRGIDTPVTILVHLFIDPNDISRDSTAFIRGFDEGHELNVLSHPVGDRGRWKLAALIELHLKDSSTDWVVLGDPNGAEIISSLEPSPKLKAIRSRQNDPFEALLGVGSVIPVPGLFGNAQDPGSEPQTPRAALKPPPAVSPTATVKRSLSRVSSPVPSIISTSAPPSPQQPSVLPPSAVRSVVGPPRFSPSPTYPAYHIGLPPWHTGSHSTSGGSIISSTTGGSLLDQYYAGKTDTPSQSIPRMMIPYDPTIEGSIAGSPPESDEDEPSVALPHSAKKFVLRPVEIGAANDSRPVTPHSEISRDNGA